MAKYLIFGVFPLFGSMIGHMSLIQFSIRNKIICSYQILISSIPSFVEVVHNKAMFSKRLIQNLPSPPKKAKLILKVKPEVEKGRNKWTINTQVKRFTRPCI